MAGDALLRGRIGQHLAAVHVLEERMLALLRIRQRLVCNGDDAGGPRLVGLVCCGNLGLEPRGFEVRNLNGPQVGDALVEGVASSLEVLQVLVFGVGQVTRLVGGQVDDCLLGVAEFGAFLDQLVKQLHDLALLDRWVHPRVQTRCWERRGPRRSSTTVAAVTRVFIRRRAGASTWRAVALLPGHRGRTPAPIRPEPRSTPEL